MEPRGPTGLGPVLGDIGTGGGGIAGQLVGWTAGPAAGQALLPPGSAQAALPAPSAPLALPPAPSGNVELHELAKARQELGIPAIGTPHGGESVLAKLKIGGQEFLGINSSTGGMSQPAYDFFMELNDTSRLKGEKMPLAQFYTHAEGDTLMQAYDRI